MSSVSCANFAQEGLRDAQCEVRTARCHMKSKHRWKEVASFRKVSKRFSGAMMAVFRDAY